ncbi:putative acetolactate synthase isozyme 1 large subunit [Sulfitobacter guttiformis KCTC 32187]|uniref:Acetolactate synthase-1/2/3 large subunit/5-guanidino-2-oxopentanoate decarboxylase n=1 Tax=Sulfitobacter guttiformis TaxID=74349 RepID=A0A420DJM5_9RHOB|nr:putative acetolactate synthase isozyme 1 large subunit [Sulfitobacter guttiformis KCTC 32187]RKE94427.1 acetolactate synthase-1/2/3 large subunit/5-guanidino-2-oxopentanoate decarboxylase [Sulfitobacter guttiformis]
MSDPATRPLGAQISHLLKARGVDVVFGIPGVHNQEMYRGIEEAGITHVLARHEQGAGFMADGYARASGKVGVAYVITGPGLCNIMTPMGQAYSDSVPMLVISSCLDETAAKRGQLHQMKDQRAAAETVCDWSEEARTAEAAYALINRAFQEFHTKRRRPKHIQVPIGALVALAAQPGESDRGLSIGIEQLSEVDLILPHMLRKARRPVFILGGGAVDATPEIRSLLGRCQIPVFTTYAGRGIVGADYPLLFGSNLARPDSANILASSDLVITVGSELAEVDLWRDHAGHNCPMVRIDIDPECLADNSGTTLRIKATAQTVFRALEEIRDLPATFEWTQAEVSQARARWRAEIDAERPGILPFCDAVRAALPEGAMIYSDMTQFAYAAKEVWDMDEPGHWHHPYGFGTLGYALPAAIGGAIARQGKPTMAIIGDYGFHYTMQELGVAVELGLSLPIILWDNGKLGEIEDSMVRAQIAPNAVIAQNPDFL